MSPEQRSECERLRNLPSAEAAEYIVRMSSSDEGTIDYVSIIPHISWGREEQFRLGRHFLHDIPHASDRAYRALISIMPAHRLATIISGMLPRKIKDISLLGYYLKPILIDACTTQKDRKTVMALLREIETIGE
ncbi:hypothetical protein QTA57_11010 [Fontisubflavum oceani]|uniref:hypothetical protein n=1 Tax=Fontisubflavum oceani TaxID=2978973 RepID=UPI0025B2E120|nr:hypothetical protein [Fontisubflavum oceani]WJY20395.1 hypothetical protein QTA57_11010 [Fontisubflavum oceani]